MYNVLQISFDFIHNLVCSEHGNYISGELLEGVEHIKAMEVDDSCCQCVIVSGHGLKEFV